MEQKMNVLVILFSSAAVFYLGYRFYARFIEKVFDVDGSHVTPAVEVNDGVDYVPSRRFVVFGHHFASIAGGGPIIGPTVALVFGYVPVWLWIVLGTLFIGAVHDFSALLASMRENGRSIAEIAKKTLGPAGFLLFIGFTVIMLVMLTSVFLTLTSTALSSKYPVSYFGAGMTGIQTIVENGVTYAVIGGIASTSVMIITLCSPLLGFLLYKKGINIITASVLAIGICMASIQIGLLFPLKIDPLIWMVILSFYTLVAAGIPVWVILQPRDFTNSFLLYGGVAGLFVGAVMTGFAGGEMHAPATNLAFAKLHLGHLWPILFITVACGAISGFHSLVAGGTTAKQVSKEKPDAKVIAYGGMVLEALLALGVLIALCVGMEYSQYTALVFPSDPSVKSNPILAFALGMGSLLQKTTGLSLVFGTVFGILMVEGFVVTTLDTAVRLNRYLLEELWRMLFKNVPRVFNSYIFNSFLCVILMFVLAYYNAFKQLWQLFGAANQLLAALTLLTVSAWLMKKGKHYLFVLIPSLFMMVTTIAALGMVLVNDYVPKRNGMLAAGDILLLALALGVIGLAINMVGRRKMKPSEILFRTETQRRRG
jgi:carbon starvation protein